MSTTRYGNLLKGRVAYDLKHDFGSINLSKAGELEMYRDFKESILIGLGTPAIMLSRDAELFDLLEVTRLSYDDSTNLFLIRNLRPDSHGTTITLSDERIEHNNPDIPEDFAVVGRRSITVGNKATGELDLGRYSSRFHFTMRLGNMAGRLYFYDGSIDTPASTNGTTVFLDKRDAQLVNQSHRKDRYIGNGTVQTKEEINGSWSR